MSELAPILDTLTAQFPWLVKLAAFIGFARLLIKPIGLGLRGLITRAYERAITTSDTNDDHWLESLIQSRPYAIFAFLLDLFASVKLPLAEDLWKPNPPTP